MRKIALLPVIAMLLSVLHARDAYADDVLYRCESAAGISIQGTPCPKDSAQRKIALQRPAAVAVSPTPPQASQSVAPAVPASAMPLTPASAIRGPNDPYWLWECMRADGSTFDSRTGIAGKQWVVKPTTDEGATEDNVQPSTPAKVTVKPKLHELIVRPVDEAGSVDTPAAAEPAPPPGAAPGKWVADQCVRLDPQQACERFATRRDILRKQIYAAKPSERATYAPEEQDLTSMLFAACQR